MTKILIADDEYAERELLADILCRRMPHEAEVRTAEHGRGAVEAAVLWGADLVLLDIEMPGINGLDAARQILAQRPGTKVLFITAYSLFEYAHEAVHLGACDYILKPVQPDEVEASVRRAIAQAEAQRQLEELAREGALPRDEEAEDPETAPLAMAKVKSYLQQNYMNDISLDSVSDILHISPSYLSVSFKRAFGVGFLDCLTDLRIQAAKELLADPLRPSAEVARLVGYESASYFTRAFKKKTGQTPTEYRRQRTGQPKGGPA